MKVLDPGHYYELKVLDSAPDAFLYLCFVKRVGEKYPGNLFSHHGTTSQEALRALIERAAYVNRQIPSWETRLGRFLMKITVWLFERRAAKRHGRSAPSIHEAVYGLCCARCGHVGCSASCG